MKMIYVLVLGPIFLIALGSSLLRVRRLRRKAHKLGWTLIFVGILTFPIIPWIALSQLVSVVSMGSGVDW
jgi:hypothetical protein